MKNLIYVSRAGLPVDAAGIRIRYIGRIMKRLGYSVHYICDRRVDKFILSSGFEQINNFAGSNVFLEKKCVNFSNEGSVYSYLPEHNGSKLTSAIDRMEFRFAFRAVRRIKNACKKEQAEAIIFYNDANFLANRLEKYCRKHGIRMLADVTEWYEKNENSTSVGKAIVANTDKRITVCDRKLDGVISISPFLHDHYTLLGVKSVFIPPLMEVSGNIAASDGDLIRFVYAGSPGAKDIIAPFINAVVNANSKNKKFRLDLIGIDIKYVHSIGCPLASEENGVYAHGRLPHDKTVEIVRAADFGVLLRHDKRYAKAGFSTKFAECMSLGVAMICNRIGGTDLFVEDGIDGFLIDGVDGESISLLLDKIAHMDKNGLLDMKKAALSKAARLFDLEAYIDKMSRFLSEIQ